MENTRWIVVGTDFSTGAACALDEAVNLAAKVDASVACVHAYEDLPGTSFQDDPTIAADAQLAEAVAASSARAKGVRVERIVRRGRAWEKLLNVACELGAPLIVVGANGEGHAPHQMFLGRVASRLTSIATRMVLIVPGRVDASLSFEDDAITRAIAS
jgi:nucleotide-binding universal stress UspA family protein